VGNGPARTIFWYEREQTAFLYDCTF